jgi:hypothetical protein
MRKWSLIIAGILCFVAAFVANEYFFMRTPWFQETFLRRRLANIPFGLLTVVGFSLILAGLKARSKSPQSTD